ncbi:nucleotide exchange factor GrpE [Mycolicibacter algericus]|uniref:Protein GrpE n=2 Tax=Mycolicibacter algericus TaxID=1288388 RepID=A0A7I9YG95_MYCAL|nr:nucleotide exchange factor GrpE [Mycolicibacter algericus]OQZ98788.1 nucleotide exchange factor GrpE [Mycolicibacter algericus DSM 45454]GFG87629.1 protein GrpE [Mycolicibacter algericus]
MSEGDSREPAPEKITVTDKRRIDPETGEVRAGPAGPAPSEPAPADPVVDGGEVDQVAELTADLQRVQADFANYRKRALRDQQGVADRAKASVVTELLPILDDLDRARSHGDLEAGPLKALGDKLTSVLDGLGLAAFGVEGDEFDPLLHEAVQHEGDGSHSVIGTVLRQGYKLGEQVLRHAMVGVVDTVPDGDQGSSGADADDEDGGDEN